MIRKQQSKHISPPRIHRQSFSNRSPEAPHKKDKRNQHAKVHNYKLANGSVYSGQMLYGKFDGKGELVYADKQKYDGYFFKGMKHGFGKYYYKNGQYYIGDWVDNKKEGKGIYFCANNTRYQGQYKNNMKSGKGKIIEDNGNYYEGYFCENNKDKQGHYYDVQNNKVFKFIFDKGKQVASAEVVQMPDLKSEKQIQQPRIGQGSIPQFLLVDPQRIIEQIVSGYINPPLKTDKSLLASSIEKYASQYKQIDSLYKNPFSKNQFNSDLKTEKLCIKSQHLRYKRIDEWDIEDVCQWLSEIYFFDFQTDFRYQKINGFSLLLLNKNDLKELNIVNASDKHIFMRQVKFLQLFFKLQCLGDRGIKLQNLDLTIQLIKKVSEKQQQQNKKKQQIQNGVQKKQQKLIPSIQNNDQENDNDSSSSSSSSSSQQAKQINLIEEKSKNQKQGLKKWEKKRRAKMTMQKKIQAIMKKRGIDYKIVIPSQQVEINKTIGKGGYGEVYLATWMGQHVAVKRYTKRKGFRNRHIGHFLEQAQIINKLSHPNIVLFMGMFIYGNQYAIVMQYLSGGSLFDYLHKNGYKPSFTRIFNICKDIALGMSYLHGKNILHCDLKSSNVLIDQNWTVKISDFGLSQIKNIKKTKHLKGTKIGTPQWMAPQVMRGQKYQFSCDVYSFGIIIWELLTNQIPYRNLTQKQIIQRVGKQSFIEIPQQTQQNSLFINLLKKCTQRQPSERITFQQAVELLEQQQHKFIPNKLIKSTSKYKEQKLVRNYD